MAINGLGSFDMMSAYNRINVSDQAVNAAKAGLNKSQAAEETQGVRESQSAIRPVEPVKEEVKSQDEELKVNLNLDGMRRRTGFNLDDISRDFSKREAFSMTRVDDQQMQSDMKKAVSDMEKDQSLMQYQYFVGDSSVILNNEDGIVIMK